MFGSKNAPKKEAPPAFIQSAQTNPVMPEPDEDDCVHALKEIEIQRAKWNSFLKNKKDVWNEKWLWDGNIRAEMSSNQLKKKFMQMFSWKVQTQKQVKFLVRGGVPPELRGHVWWACSGAAEKLQAAAPEEQYSALLPRIEALTGTSIGNDIEKDLMRTFPERINAGNTSTVDALRRCLRCYALRNPEVGYCQSMNYICALLLFHMTEEQAFWVFACVIEDILPNNYYTPSLIGGRVDQQVFQSCIAWKLPKLFSVFKSTNTLLEPIICPWFLCLYINVLPLSVVCRVWDCMFWEGSVVLFRIGLTLMKSKSKYIIEANDFVAIYTILKVSNSKTYSFELESRDKDGASPGSPGGVSPQPLGGLDVLQDFGNISRAEFLINSAFGFRWLKSVPKEQVEVLRKKFLALLEGDRAERLASNSSAHGTPVEALKSAASPTASGGLTSRFSGLFRISSSHAVGGDSTSPASSSAPGSPMSAGKSASGETEATAAEKAELAATISKHQSKSHGSTQRGGRSRQSMAMLKLLEELEYVLYSHRYLFLCRL
jgi:hypothetical protein